MRVKIFAKPNALFKAFNPPAGKMTNCSSFLAADMQFHIIIHNVTKYRRN